MSKLVTVATFNQPIEAHVAKGKLESEGIECFLQNENTIATNVFYSQALGGVKLQVHESDAERASIYLGTREKTPPPAADPRVCPRCGSLETRFQRRFPFFRRELVCNRCSKRSVQDCIKGR